MEVPALEILKSIDIDSIKVQLAEIENELERHIQAKKSEMSILKRLIKAVEYVRGEPVVLAGDERNHKKKPYKTRVDKGFHRDGTPIVAPIRGKLSEVESGEKKVISEVREEGTHLSSVDRYDKRFKRKPETDESVADAAYIYLEASVTASCRAIGESLKLIDPSSVRRILCNDDRFEAVPNKVDWFQLAR